MGYTSQLDTFLNLHKEQLVSSNIPERYWNTINEKIQNQIFNAGETFQLIQIEYEEQKKPHEPTWGLQVISKVSKTDPKHVYLIDHAWTFRVEQAKNQLLEYESLRNRLCNILGINSSFSKEEVTDNIFDNMWKVVNTYSIGNANSVEDRLPIWYFMDEIGCAVMHSNTPNCRIVPFVDANSQITYSLLFPIEDMDEEEFAFRDFAEGIVDSEKRTAALLPWVPHSFTSSFTPEIPGAEYYLSGHIEESLPSQDFIDSWIKPNNKEKYKVFTEYELIKQYLTSPHFEIVESEEEAEILWYTRHFKDYKTLSNSPEKFVNQFPFEYVLTIKDLLSLTCRRASKTTEIDSIKWYPITYNLKTEIANFISYFQHREKENLDNFWIAKPYNLARSLDVHITNNLDYLMRLSTTGPKIVQEYILNPVLFSRPELEGSVKFDIRYVILLKSVSPLKAYVFNEFFLRFANKPYERNDFHVYEKHFTVMNYNEEATLKKMLCAEFKTEWEKNYPHFTWSSVERDILKMLKEILQSAVDTPPPCGIAHNPQSRALYAADLMLAWSGRLEIQPKILEINWTPDCKRACEYYPEFYNDIFELLFMDKVSASFTEL